MPCCKGKTRGWPRRKSFEPMASIRRRSRYLGNQPRVGYLERRLFDDYEPSQYWRFKEKLDGWLANLSEDDLQRTLYKLIGCLFFVGRREFESLCRAAFHGPITRWLIDQTDLQLWDPIGQNKLSSAADQTWFCPVTDSMRINAFLKVTNLEGQKHRPDWRSLARFGDPKRIVDFVRREKIKRIALLEDFVGTGLQSGRLYRLPAIEA